MSDKKLDNYIYCPECEGSGLDKKGAKTCRNCYGTGFGMFFGDYFLYWGRKMSASAIHWARNKRYVDNVIDFSAGLFFLAGCLSLVFWLWFYPIDAFLVYGGVSESFWSHLMFWRFRDPLLLVFWWGFLSGMFLYYRLWRKRLARPIIKRVAPQIPSHLLPNNWGELRTHIRKHKATDVSIYFKPSAFILLEKALLRAEKSDHKRVELSHLFLALLENGHATSVFSRLNIDINPVVEKVRKLVASLPPLDIPADFSNDLKEALVEAYRDASLNSQKYVDSLNLFLPCLAKDEHLAAILDEVSIDYDTAANVVSWFRINDRLIENYRHYRHVARWKPASSMDRAYTAVATPVLNHYSCDITLAAKLGHLEICVARETEITAVFQSWLAGRRGVVLSGPAGVGKRAISSGIAELMVKEEVPQVFKDKRLVELDIPRLLSGATPAQAQERLMVVLDEVARAGNIVLYMENIEKLIGISAGGEESLELADVLVSAIETGGFFCLATTTEENYQNYVHGRPLGNALERVVVDEPAGNHAIRIIESRAAYLESKFKVYFSYQAIKRAVEQTDKYIHDKYLPEKAFDILEGVAVAVASERGKGSVISAEDVSAAISAKTGVPLTRVNEDEGQKLIHLEELMHERMIGQTEAVKAVSDSLRRARLRMRAERRPIASFLFLGPTGVGKTELAKTVAGVYFGGEEYMIRLDMSEYQHPDSVANLIGASGQTGHLTESVRKMPFSLVLLDEVEKAHPDILNLFLQVIDDGRLTDGQGKTVDFTNCIIIATSNAGALFVQREIAAETDMDTIRRRLIDEHLVNVMRPELINRFDGVIVFRPLTLADVAKITRLLLSETAKMLEEKGVNLMVDNSGIIKLAAAGYDPKYGARPLRRLIQDKVDNAIANLFLSGELTRRDTVIIDASAKISVEKAKPV
jgi:ATP-dependent Clp protease ATP-binding subunit ClpC